LVRKKQAKKSSRKKGSEEEDEEIEAVQQPEITGGRKKAHEAPAAYDPSDRTSKIREADAKAKAAPAADKTGGLEEKVEGTRILSRQEALQSSAPVRAFTGLSNKDKADFAAPYKSAVQPKQAPKPKLEEKVQRDAAPVTLKTDEQLYEENKDLQKVIENLKKERDVKDVELKGLRQYVRRLEVDVKAITQYVHESIEEIDSEMNRIESNKAEMLAKDPMSRMIKIEGEPIMTVKNAEFYLDNITKQILRCEQEGKPVGIINGHKERKEKIKELIKLATEGKVFVVRRYNYMLKQHEYINIHVDDLPRERESLLVAKGARMGKGLRIKDLTEALEEKKKRDKERGIQKPDSAYLFKFKGVDVYLEDQDIIKSMAVEGAIALQRNEDFEKELEILRKVNKDADRVVEEYENRIRDNINQIKQKETEKKELEERIRALQVSQQKNLDDAYNRGSQEASAKWIQVNQDAAQKLSESVKREEELRLQLTNTAREKIDMSVAEQRAKQNLEAEHRKRIEQKDSEIRAANEKIAELERKKGQLEINEQSLNSEIDTLRKKADGLEAERQQLSNEKSEFARERAGLVRRADEKEREGIAKGKENAREEIDRQVEANSHPLYVKKTDFQKEKEAKEGLEKKASELDGLISAFRKELEEKEGNLRSTNAEKGRVEKELNDTKARLSEIESRTVTLNDLNNAFPLKSEGDIVGLMKSVGAEPDEHGNYNSNDLAKAKSKLEQSVDQKQLWDDNKVDDDLRKRAVELGILQEIQDGSVTKYVVLNAAALEEIRGLENDLKSEKFRTKNLQDQLKDYKKSQETGSQLNDRLNSQIKSKQKRVDALTQQISEQEELVQQLERELANEKGQNENIASELEQAKSQLSLYESQKNELQGIIERQNKSISERDEKLRKASEDISGLEKAIAENRQKISDQEKEISRLGKATELDELAITSLNDRCSVLQAELEAATKKINAQKEREYLIKESAAGKDKRIAEICQELESAQNKLAEKQAELGDKNALLDALNSAKSKLEAENTSLTAELTQAKNLNAQYERESTALKTAKESLEGTVEQQRSAIDGQGQKISELDGNVAGLTAMLATAKANTSKEKATYETKLAQKDSEISELKAKIGEETEAKNAALKSIVSLNSDAGEKASKIAEYEGRIKGLEKELADAKSERERIVGEASQYSKKMQEYDAELRKLKDAKSALESKLASEASEKGAAADEAAKYSKSLEEKDAQIKKIEEARSAFEQELNTEKAERRKAQSELVNVQSVYKTAQDEVKNLQECLKREEKQIEERIEKCKSLEDERNKAKASLNEANATIGELSKSKLELENEKKKLAKSVEDERSVATKASQDAADYKSQLEEKELALGNLTVDSSQKSEELEKRKGVRGFVYILKEGGRKAKMAVAAGILGAALIAGGAGYTIRGAQTAPETVIQYGHSETQAGIIEKIIQRGLEDEPFVLRNADFDTFVKKFAKEYLGENATRQQIEYIREKVLLPALDDSTRENIRRWRSEKQDYIIKAKPRDFW
jgi:chromosome segregation ATPase